MNLLCYSPTPEVETALADLFGRRINELLPDRDINDFALNWDAAAGASASRPSRGRTN